MSKRKQKRAVNRKCWRVECLAGDTWKPSCCNEEGPFTKAQAVAKAGKLESLYMRYRIVKVKP